MAMASNSYHFAGTLTKNEMTVVAVRTSSASIRVTGSGYSPEEGKLLLQDVPLSGKIGGSK